MLVVLCDYLRNGYLVAARTCSITLYIRSGRLFEPGSDRILSQTLSIVEVVPRCVRDGSRVPSPSTHTSSPLAYHPCAVSSKPHISNLQSRKPQSKHSTHEPVHPPLPNTLPINKKQRADKALSIPKMHGDTIN